MAHAEQLSAITRRRFLRQSFAFSALAALGSDFALAHSPSAGPGAHEVLMIGDWGYENAEAQTRVAAGMTAYARKNAIHPDAFFLLGDNWYGALEGGVNSARWKTNFEDLYPREVYDCPAYAVLGNHDYQRWPESKVEAELAYARIPGSRWIMPARWYTFEFPKKNPLITFIALDSNMPHPAKSDSSSKPDKPARDFTLTPEEKDRQLAWLTAELERPRATPYLAVIAHHPVYSNGPHGDHPTLIADWDPLFRKHNVTLYLAGHDHDLQHLEFEGHPTSFFLSGGGGADLYDFKKDPAQRGPYGQKVYGFSHLSVTREQLTLRHLDSEGRLVHAFSKTPAGKITLAAS
jgi:tartrate-resistant acid phosphatase type 5